MKNKIELTASPRLEKLSKVATEMFLSEGYEALSVDSLIQQVGGSKRNIYSNFKGKEGLFIKIVTDLCAELSKPMTELEITKQEPKEALEQFCRHVLEAVLDSRTLAIHRMMIAEAARFPELATAIWNAGHANACLFLSEWIKEQQKARNLSKKRDADFLANQFISMLTGHLQLKYLLNPESKRPSKKELDQFIGSTVDSFLTGNLALTKESK